MSTSDCNPGDVTMYRPKKPLVSLDGTWDLQWQKPYSNWWEKQARKASVNGEQHLNKPGSNFYLQETSIPPHGHVNALSVLVKQSVRKVPKSLQLLSVQDSYSNKKHENPSKFQINENYIHIRKQTLNDQKRNYIESSYPQCKEPSLEPPEFNLYKNPVALTYPSFISCAISERPDRLERHAVNNPSSGGTVSRKPKLC